MISFMVIGAPRSGTSWAANWLTTDKTLCLHDPLFKHHFLELDDIKSSRALGVSCTGLAMFADFVNQHPAPKVVLHRDIDEINSSLENIGMPILPKSWPHLLDRIHGLHVIWTELFDNPAPIYRHLFGSDHDHERHEILRELEVQTRYEGSRSTAKQRADS